MLKRVFIYGTLVAICGLLAGCDESAGGPSYEPRMVMPTADLLHPRGYSVHRGIIHAHSPYSHDACDGLGFDANGVRNEPCLDDMRHGLCATMQDFVFLTDHDDRYEEHEYPDVILYKDGDSLIERGGIPVANRLICPDGHQVIVSAGTESAMMSIGIEHHLGDTPSERHTAYNTIDGTAIGALHDAGALVLFQHTEDWSVDQMVNLPIDGIEIYNLHFGLLSNVAVTAELVLLGNFEPERVPDPELGLIGPFVELDEYLSKWSDALQVKPLIGVIGSDVHQNVVDEQLPDGERLDSYRRIMRWFSNWVFVPPGEAADDLVLKEAIRNRRLMGVFEYLGYPVGFDYYADVGGTSHEIGAIIPPAQAAGARLHVTVPTVWRRGGGAEKPAIRGRILRAANGGWEEVAQSDADFSYDAAQPGIYRAEIRILPNHLIEWMGNEFETYLVEQVWIYTNPIFVGIDYGAGP